MSSEVVLGNPTISPSNRAEAMSVIVETGEAMALQLGNRGPVRYNSSGEIHGDILSAYSEQGFYVFTNLIADDEIEELRAEMDSVLARAPVGPDSDLDADGNTAIGMDFAQNPFQFAKPLSDPFGGTDALQGRYEVKLAEPEAAADAPDYTVVLVKANPQLMDSCLRLYGHPALLSIAEAVSGPDFAPFCNNTFVKEPGLGAAVSWHQDGTTHWDSPDLDENTHGFNFMINLYQSNGSNGVWVVPGTHKQGKADIKAMERDAGTERLPGAVPLLCDAGDVIINNRQLIHGSFANTSPDRRVSIGIGFFPYKSVLNMTTERHADGELDTYTADRIRERSRIIQVAIDARHQKYPYERKFSYAPFVGDEGQNRWNDQTKATVVRDYYLLDMSI